jgi:hypothetical protein
MMGQDEAAIVMSLANRYALAVDTQRWDMFDEVFTEDVVADYGPTAIWKDLASFKRDFAIYHDPFDGTQHTMSNMVWDFKGDSARAVTYGHWRLIRYGLGGGDFWEGQGWYDDELVRLDAGWRIKNRVCRIIWWGGNPQVNETVPGVKFQLNVTSLRQSADEGSLGFLAAR